MIPPSCQQREFTLAHPEQLAFRDALVVQAGRKNGSRPDPLLSLFLLNLFVSFSGNIFGDIGESAGDMFGGLGGFFSDVGDALGNAIDVADLAGGVVDAAGDLAQDAGDLMGDGMEVAGELAGDIGEGIGDGLDAAGDFAGDAADAVGDGLDAAGDLAGDAADAVGDGLNAAGDFAGDAVEAIGDAVTGGDGVRGAEDVEMYGGAGPMDLDDEGPTGGGSFAKVGGSSPGVLNDDWFCRGSTAAPPCARWFRESWGEIYASIVPDTSLSQRYPHPENVHGEEFPSLFV